MSLNVNELHVGPKVPSKNEHYIPRKRNLKAVLSPHANHVITKAIEVLPIALTGFVAAELSSIATQVARHKYGTPALGCPAKRRDPDLLIGNCQNTLCL